jgi:hypothetical protein
VQGHAYDTTLIGSRVYQAEGERLKQPGRAAGLIRGREAIYTGGGIVLGDFSMCKIIYLDILHLMNHF